MNEVLCKVVAHEPVCPDRPHYDSGVDLPKSDESVLASRA